MTSTTSSCSTEPIPSPDSSSQTPEVSVILDFLLESLVSSVDFLFVLVLELLLFLVLVVPLGLPSVSTSVRSSDIQPSEEQVRTDELTEAVETTTKRGRGRPKGTKGKKKSLHKEDRMLG